MSTPPPPSMPPSIPPQPLPYATPGMGSPVHLASPAVTPASPQHLAQIAMARQQFRKIGRAASTAALSGWSIAIFGFLTLITGFMTFSGVMLGVGMCLIAYFELLGAKLIRRLDPDVTKRLAINQLIFGVLLTIYACSSMWTALHGPSEIDDALRNEPDATQMFRIDQPDGTHDHDCPVLLSDSRCGSRLWRNGVVLHQPAEIHRRLSARSAAMDHRSAKGGDERVRSLMYPGLRSTSGPGV